MQSIQNLLVELGVDLAQYQGQDLISRSPIDGQAAIGLRADQQEQVAAKIAEAQGAFEQWRNVPAPRRGELVRLFGEELRQHKDALGTLVTMEAGKILSEGLGEVQEMID